MGEYAIQYAMERHGIDISGSNGKKTKWKWSCPICGKNLSSKISQRQHLSDKHKKKGE